MSVIKTLLSLIDNVNRVLGYLLALILAIMTILIAWQVIGRLIFDNPSSWSEELSRFLMIYLIMIGSGLATRNGGMISVDVILELLGASNTKKWLIILAQLLAIIFYIVLIIFGVQFGINSSNQVAPGTGISMGWIYLSIPFGALILLVNSIARIFSVILDDDTPQEEVIN